jgi:hypothetical protein
MASVWVARRPRKNGGVSFRVMFRLGGRESSPRYGGSFKTMREARIRRDWIAGEFAAFRVPDLRALERARPAPTLQEAAERWRASRVDVTENTRLTQRSAVRRVLPLLGRRRVD